MQYALKLIQIDSSVGVILPKEALAREKPGTDHDFPFSRSPCAIPAVAANTPTAAIIPNRIAFPLQVASRHD